MLVFVNREVWNALPDDVKVKYITDCIYSAWPEPDEDFSVDIIADNIDSIITKNEKSIDLYGIEKYRSFDMPAKDLECGFRHSTGKYAVGAFVWSMDDDYSFVLYKIL